MLCCLPDSVLLNVHVYTRLRIMKGMSNTSRVQYSRVYTVQCYSTRHTERRLALRSGAVYIQYWALASSRESTRGFRIVSYRTVPYGNRTCALQCRVQCRCVRQRRPSRRRSTAQRSAATSSCRSVCCAAMRCDARDVLRRALPSGTSAPAAASHHFCVAPARLSFCFSFRLSDGTPGADAIDIHSTRRLSLPSLCAVALPLSSASRLVSVCSSVFGLFLRFAQQFSSAI